MTFFYILQAFLIIYTSYLAGRIFCDQFTLLQEQGAAKKIIYSTGIGYGILGVLGLFLGLSKLFMPASFIVMTIGIAILSRKTIRDHIKKIRQTRVFFLLEHIQNFYSEHGLIKVVVTVWLILYAAISLLPSAMNPSDGLYYHLPFAMEFVQNTGISFPIRNELAYGHLPLFTEIFYGIPISVFHNFVSFKIVQFATFFFLVALLVGFATRYVANKIFAWILFVLLLANMPLVKSALEGGMIDIFTMFFGFVALVSITEAIIDRQTETTAHKSFILASIFLGLALSTKYIALFFVLICWLFLLFFYLKNNLTLRKIAARLSLYFFITFTICGFWYVKNIIYTGSPFFPMFSSSVDGFTDAVNAFVLERTPLNFPLLPFFFFGKEGMFLPYALITAGTFMSMYASIIFLFIKRRIGTIEILLFVFIETYLFILFLTSHQIRFAIPALVGASVLLIFALDKISSLIRENYPQTARFSPYQNIIVGVLAILLLLASMWSTTLKKNTLCLVGIKSSDTCFHEIAGASIHVTNYINNNLRGETVLEYWNIFYFFHLKNGNYYSRLWCEGENDKEAQIALCLKANNISYLIDDTKSSALFAKHPERDRMKEKIFLVEYFKKHGTIIYEFFDQKTNSYLRLYKLQ